MTTRITGGVHVDRAELHHRVLDTGSGVIIFGAQDHWPRVDVFFPSTADIDAVIAELVALRAEMDPPVITDSDRTCDQANPGTGAWCHRGGDHDEHRDTDGETWRTDEASRTPGAPLCDSELPLKHGGVLKCTLDNGHYGAHSAIAGECRWLSHGDDARDENGDRIAPASVTA